jgi:glutamate racemase
MSAPIGVFDSGVGGISILIELRKLLPAENLIYFADSGHCPYGTKPPDQIKARTLKIAEILISKGVKAIVVACNAACTTGLEPIREHYPRLPVIGIEPALKPAHDLSRNGKIGVLATNLTLQGERFLHLVEKYGTGVAVFTQPAPGLADLVEQGQLDTIETKDLLQKYLQPLLTKGIDTLILGCTHYPFVRPLIQEICGPNVVILDNGLAIAKQTARMLEQQNLLTSVAQCGEVTFYTSGDAAQVKMILHKLWPEPINEVIQTE